MKSSLFLLAASLLTSLAQAERQRATPKEVTITTKHRDEVAVLDNPVVEKRELTEREYHVACLIPTQGQEPDVDDCFTVCEFLTEQNPSIQIPPDDMVIVNAGVCEFTILNIGCFWRSTSGATVYPACRSLLTTCVYNGHDGLMQDPNSDIAYSITGAEAAPQYAHPSCPAS
ncbi:hypothetical protein FE257_006932 [Aspergillus nanangensis]|uniref:Uncharacterized protein n=1 Tax=Aspergillus nanangensis TaxID=2582783 RepID=A0AAD4GUK3_ASPNN|nr:hypothetical protein FE257_006932 [Aspergillus nanangensis]